MAQFRSKSSDKISVKAGGGKRSGQLSHIQTLLKILNCVIIKERASKEVVSMKTIITGKNYSPSDKLKETIEKKFEKAG